MNDALARATAAVHAATPRAQADPTRPIFHVAAPAQWINDPNGPIFYKGYYHLFYQLDPFSDKGGIKYWGHVRSRDLAKWEHLPIAIAPSGDKGEESIWSGYKIPPKDFSLWRKFKRSADPLMHRSLAPR